VSRLPAVRRPPDAEPRGPVERVADVIVELVSRVPATAQHEVADPEVVVQQLTRQAARRAAMVSGGLALPPGPMGLFTLLPDLLAIWRIQAQLVADIAGARGRSGSLTREQMLYCLFRHAASQVLRDLVVRAGERAIVHRLTVTALQAIATRLGLQVSQQLVAKSASRWVPGLGAAAVAAYAWWDTERVARTADALFAREIVVEPPPEPVPPGPGAARAWFGRAKVRAGRPPPAAPGAR